jgi:TRAP-type uncharacterized transport system substrate-binding protein
MTNRRPLAKPHIEHHLLESVEDEFHALRSFVWHHWYVVLVLLVGIGLLAYVVRPFPPSTVTIATGPPDSSYDDLGEWFAAYFRRNGVSLNLVASKGPVENVDLLASGKVDAAFALGGIPVPNDRGIVSLGSVQFEPLWLLHRDAAAGGGDLFAFLSGKRLAIGLPGSGTRFLVEELLREHRRDALRSVAVTESSEADAAIALRAGRIDAMFVLADTDSPLLAGLLHDPSLHVWNFATARAVAGRMPHVYAVVYPAGASSLSPIRPPQDVELVATNAKVLVRDDLHPAIQYLFLMAASDYYDNNRYAFDRPGGFPAFLDHDVRKSEVAAKYFEHHSTALEATFPYWVTSLLDRVWLLVAAIAAILLPLTKLVPKYRKLHFAMEVEERYADIRAIEAGLLAAASPADLREARTAFDALQRNVAAMWVPTGLTEKYYFLIGAIEPLRARIADAESIQASPRTGASASLTDSRLPAGPIPLED